MSWRSTTMTDDELDRSVAAFLDWRSQRLDGAAGAREIAWRIADPRRTSRRRWALAMAGLGLAGVLIVATAGIVAMATRPPEPAGPITNGPIVMVDALGWRAIDPSTGVETTLEPCDGLCPGAVSLVGSADGRTVFYVQPTPIVADGTAAAPGWTLWRWDRDAGTTTEVHGCAPSCLVLGPVPSPDGRSVAFGEASSMTGDAPIDIVVVDATTGRETYRRRETQAMLPAWDAHGRLILTVGKAGGIVRERVDLATGVSEVVGAGLPNGHLSSSPDGTRMVLILPDMPAIEVHLVDPGLERSRLLIRADDMALWTAPVWAPDGSALVNMARAADSMSSEVDVRTYDLATGAVEVRGQGFVGTGLTWLAAD